MAQPGSSQADRTFRRGFGSMPEYGRYVKPPVAGPETTSPTQRPEIRLQSAAQCIVICEEAIRKENDQRIRLTGGVQIRLVSRRRCGGAPP
jgi:hypothetical protein